jgi:hypothetical protein
LRRRILLLNLLLAGLTALACWQLRKEWLAAKAREEAVLRKSIRPVPPPPAGAPQLALPVTAAAYNEIAQKMLFSKDRNPVVVVETAPPPPPPPMPPLPVLLGVMNLGDGPMAILSEKPNMPNREYRAGQQIGEFKLVAINSREIVLEWNGKQVVRRLEDLVQRHQREEAAPQRTDGPAPAAPAPAAVTRVQAGPGVDIGRGVRACVANDSTPAGAVVDGMRKVVSDSPFGAVCRWEPVR